MAVDKRAFGKISDADQAIVREVMGRTYENFDKVNLVDNRGARDALLNTGIEVVPVTTEEYDKVRAALMELNTDLANQGQFDKVMFDEMLRYIEEYRSEH
jgi:TRAP-type C4-dicarboxylate transport system substrate-binding protein